MDVVSSIFRDIRLPLEGRFIAAYALAAFIALRLYKSSRHPRTPRLKGPPRESLIFGVSKKLFSAPDPGVLFQAWEKAYGPVYETPSSLGSRAIALCDPKAISQFFTKDTFTYHQPNIAKELSRRTFGAMLIVVEGETHKRQRRALSTAFSISATRNLTSVFLDSAHKLNDAWNTLFESQPESQSLTIDVQKWMNYVSLDSIGNGGFSHDFGALKGRTSPIMTALDSFASVKPTLIIMLFFLIGPLFPKLFTSIPTKRRAMSKELNMRVKEIAGELLEKAEKAKGMGVEGVDKSIIGTLLKSENASSRIQLSIDEIMAQMHLLIAAGYETTSITLTWALIELARNLDIQNNLRAELQKHLGRDQDPNYDQLVNGLPYLDAFTSELLRMRPAAPEIIRMAAEDDTLPLTDPITTASGEVIDSLFVAKGTVIRVPIVGINRSETLWGSDAGKFNPERWLVTEEESAKAAARKEEIQGYKHLLTFAFGPRMCLGRNFALTEFKTVISVLVRNYSFELPDGPETKLESHRSILVRPKLAGEDGPRLPLIVTRVPAE